MINWSPNSSYLLNFISASFGTRIPNVPRFFCVEKLFSPGRSAIDDRSRKHEERSSGRFPSPRLPRVVEPSRVRQDPCRGIAAGRLTTRGGGCHFGDLAQSKPEESSCRTQQDRGSKLRLSRLEGRKPGDRTPGARELARSRRRLSPTEQIKTVCVQRWRPHRNIGQQWSRRGTSTPSEV